MLEMGTLFFVSFLMAQLAGASSNNLNYFSCLYAKGTAGWELHLMNTSMAPFNLAEGQVEYVAAAWSNHPALSSGVCATMTGTDSDDTVQITNFKYRADEIAEIFHDCSAKGTDLNLELTKIDSVRRGGVSELQIDWDPSDPSRTKVAIVTYFPTVDELKESPIEMTEKKCADLIPTG